VVVPDAGATTKGDIRSVSHNHPHQQEIEMKRMATRFASGLAAAGLATLLVTAPAQAMLPDPHGDCVGNSCFSQTQRPGNTPSTGATPWLKIALGAAGGVALAGAGATMITSRKRHQHAGTRQAPVAG
jgi:hypothetical protein